MAALSGRRVAVLAVLLFVLLSLPNLSSTVSAGPSRPQVVYAPSPNMPLPAPTPGIVARPAPVSGVLRILVIAAAFANINSTVPVGTLKTEYFQQVAAYYQEVSYGKVTLTGDVFGWYKLPYVESHYGRDCAAIDDADCSGSDSSWQIAQDAVTIAVKQDNVNFMNYDYFVFVHSGYGEESSGVKDDVWSVTYLGGVYVQTNSKTLMKFNIVPELEAGPAVPMGVYCHEFGHLLGLPDLYNTNTGRTILGPWSLMDKGLWNGNPPGSNPSHMEAWSKIQLGFISGSTLATANPGVTSSFLVDPTEVASGNVHAVMVPIGSAGNPSRYYLIEVRATVGFDSALPATGVLIMYVDSTLFIGRGRIVDGHPSFPGLEDATWNVGQTYADSINGLAVTVIGKTGNSYQITVNRGSIQPPPNQNQTYIDLAMTSVNAQPQVINNPNTTVTITVQISNIGTQAATNVQVEVDLDGQLYTNTQVSVGAGASTQTSFTWLSVLGSHTFRIIIDPKQLINDTNRANNIASFNVNVGPTLTINVPPNVTTAGNVWVLINGVRYNLTSGQLQTSVPTGTITIQIQPAVNTSLGVRQFFTRWSDGNLTNPRQITVTSNTVMQAVYRAQYLLTVNRNEGTTTPTGWYDANTVSNVYATNPSNVTANNSRLIFSAWSGDLNSSSTSIAINMTRPVSLKANWVKQYYVTIISPTGSPKGEGWYNAGSLATVAVQSTVQYTNGTRQLFTGWNSTSLGNTPTAQIMVNAPTALQAAWKTQYLVTLQTQYGTPSGSGWYDTGSNVQVSIQPEIEYGNRTRREFAGWAGDYSATGGNVTLHVDSPKTLVAKWMTQYELRFKVTGISNSTFVKLALGNSTHDVSVNNVYQDWFYRGEQITPSVNRTISNSIFVYRFLGWYNSTGASFQNPISVDGPQDYVASYSTEITMPPIPGFPIESIAAGVMLGLLALVVGGRRRRRTPVYSKDDRTPNRSRQSGLKFVI